MSIINNTLNAIFDLLVHPLRSLNPYVGLIVVALVMAVVALLAFRYASNATAISRIKTRIGAYLLEMRLFPDDLRILVTAPLRILALNSRYMAHAFGPFLLILPPMLLVIFQIEARFGLEPLQVGDRTILTVSCGPGVDLHASSLELEISSGIVVETPAVRIPSRGEVSWRLRATADGEQWVRVIPPGGGPEQAVRKLVWVGTAPKSMARARTARHAGFGALAEPAEAPLPRGGLIEEIRVTYPHEEARPLGLSTSVWVFFLLSTAFGFLLKKRLGVTL